MIYKSNDKIGTMSTIDTRNFFTVSLKKKPIVCLLKPCFCSITNVLYSDQGMSMTNEKTIAYTMKTIDVDICKTAKILFEQKRVFPQKHPTMDMNTCIWLTSDLIQSVSKPLRLVTLKFHRSGNPPK